MGSAGQTRAPGQASFDNPLYDQPSAVLATYGDDPNSSSALNGGSGGSGYMDVGPKAGGTDDGYMDVPAADGAYTDGAWLDNDLDEV